MKSYFWRGRGDEIPDGKESYDYAEWHCDEIYCMVYDEEKKKNPHEYTTRMLFFKYEDAEKFYNDQMKKWKKDMKTYITHLKDEIEIAKENTKEAQRQIDKYSKFVN